MAATTFEALMASASNANLKKRTVLARDWFREQAQSMTISASKLMRQEKAYLQGKLTPDSIGRMYLFTYDAKLKKTLPYWDKYPLIFPIDLDKEGFLGINMHYLGPILRAKLMDKLYTIVTDRKYDEKTKLKISYSILKSASKFRYFRPCIKRYLWSHVRSQFLYIPADRWDIALFLPLAQFQKQNQYKVWSDSSVAALKR